MSSDGGPFGDSLFEGIADFDQFIRANIKTTIVFMEVRRYRADARAQRTSYQGGRVLWDGKQFSEAA